VNHTHDSITITWNAGFDGGSAQRFQVRYKELGGEVEAFKYEDVFPSSATTFAVKGT
jgi:hypothetical protein